MKIQEIQVVFNCLDGTTELSRSDTIQGIQVPNQPHDIQLVRILFDGGYMLQIDSELTVILKNDFKITYLNSEPDHLLIHGDGKNPDPAGYEGDVMDLLSQYKCPISCDDLIKMRTAHTRLMLTIS
ncbi:hypothetical protein [Aeromonas caviae]|jgi:hypothetical protein